MIVIPGPTFSDPIEQINFSIPNGSNGNSTKKCLDGHQFTTPKGIEKIIHRMRVRPLEGKLLVGQDRQDDYYVQPFMQHGKSGSDENIVNFQWEKARLLFNQTETYIIGLRVKLAPN